VPHPTTKRTVLHDAVIKGNEEAMQQLLEQKIDIEQKRHIINEYYNNKDSNDSEERCPSRTPLLLAVYNNRVSIAQLLLDYEADALKCNDEGTPVLVSAVGVGKEILTTLLRARADSKNGIDIDQEIFYEGNEDNYMTALMYAVCSARMTAAELLIRYGASVTNSQGQTIFDFCFNLRVEQNIKEYIAHITSKTNELIDQLRFFPPKIIDTIADYTSGGAYLKKNDSVSYRHRIGLFNQQDERKLSVSDRKYSDENAQAKVEQQGEKNSVKLVMS
jgi:ankyrin repeat protein